MQTVIKIKITNIKVDNRYYSFDYVVTVDGEVKPKENYDSDHAWQDDISGFKELLKSGYAAELVLSKVKVNVKRKQYSR